MTVRSRTNVLVSVAQWLVRRYPRPWRDRYQDEVLMLLDDSPVLWGDVLDLARGLVTERALSMFEPSDRPRATMMAVVLFVCGACLGSWLAAAWTGHGLRALLGPLSPGLVRAELAISGVAVMTALAVTSLRLFRWTLHNQLSAAGTIASMPPLLPRALWWTGLLLLCTALDNWAIPFWRPLTSGTLVAIFQVYLFSAGPWHAASSRMSVAIRQLSRATHEMRWALLELARCERLAVDGQPSRLVAAHAAVARATTEREDAIASLRSIGYRARFR